MAQVAAVRTPATAQAIAAALSSIWGSIVGGAPTEQALVMLVTQTDLETGAWQNMWNWNLGNLAGTAGDYVMLHSSDGTYRPYRAFASLSAGVSAYLTLLKSRYSSALLSAATGDITNFVNNLKAQGYFQETTASYIAGMQARYPSIEKALGSGPVIQPGNPASASTGPSIWTTLFGGLALGGAAYLAYEAYMFKPVPVRRRRAA
jgi:hypothetical protein